MNDFSQIRSVSIFLIVVFGLFFLPSKAFAWFEYVTSLVKVVAFLTIFWSSVAIMAGGGPKGYVHTGETWRNSVVFKNGFAVSLDNANSKRTAC